MRKWQSHKIVEAETIEGYAETTYGKKMVTNGYVDLSNHVRVTVPDDFFARGHPKHGDYLVKYADGYLSWSPAKAFEEGYTEVK